MLQVSGMGANVGREDTNVFSDHDSRKALIEVPRAS